MAPFWVGMSIAATRSRVLYDDVCDGCGMHSALQSDSKSDHQISGGMKEVKSEVKMKMK